MRQSEVKSSGEYSVHEGERAGRSGRAGSSHNGNGCRPDMSIAISQKGKPPHKTKTGGTYGRRKYSCFPLARQFCGASEAARVPFQTGRTIFGACVGAVQSAVGLSGGPRRAFLACRALTAREETPPEENQNHCSGDMEVIISCST